jgi:uncharacterized membrane protein YbaN (DUF454 family)
MKFKQYAYMALGLFCVGMAYIGIIVPGIPFSIFLVIAAWAFAKSSPRLHRWLYNHPWFGSFLTNWTERRVFPTKGKYAMILVMASSLAFLWFTTENVKAVLWSGGFMLLVAVWAWRYPGSLEDYQRRVDAGKRIAWIK